MDSKKGGGRSEGEFLEILYIRGEDFLGGMSPVSDCRATKYNNDISLWLNIVRWFPHINAERVEWDRVFYR